LLVHHHWTPFEELTHDEGEFWVAVSQLRSDGNLGTLIRTAQAAGAAGIILLDQNTDPFDPTVLRSSMGSVLSMSLSRTTLPSLITWADKCQLDLIGTSPGGGELYTTQFQRRAIVFFGEEREGLKNAELDACSRTIRIPMKPGVDSINVAVAAGIVLFEMRRQLIELPKNKEL
jgi:TrmH family RNA methyltransferase